MWKSKIERDILLIGDITLEDNRNISTNYVITFYYAPL